MINVHGLPWEWTCWKSDDIILLVKEPLEPERWRQLRVYVQTVVKPMEPHWHDDEGRLCLEVDDRWYSCRECRAAERGLYRVGKARPAKAARAFRISRER